MKSTIRRALLSIMIVALVALFAFATGCPKPSAPVVRSEVTAYAALVDKVVDLEVGTCARLVASANTPAATRPTLEAALLLAHRCQAARDGTRRSLVVLLDAVHTWTDTSSGNIGCASRDVITNVRDFRALLDVLHESIPVEVDDAIDRAVTFAAFALPSCVPTPLASASSAPASSSNVSASGLAPLPPALLAAPLTSTSASR